MTRFLVVHDRGAKSGDGISFIRDGFHVFALVLPLVWLLWNRLWLHAALLFAAMGLTAALLHHFVPEVAPAITGFVNLALGLATALEGPAWLVADREKAGASVEGAIVARNRREVEELYAAEMSVHPDSPRTTSRTFQPVSQASLIPLTGV